MALRNLATSSAVASGGRSRSAGSPVRWRMRNTTTDTPRSTSSDCQPRRTRYEVIGLGGGLRPPGRWHPTLRGLVEARHRLDVGRMGEHVDRLHPPEPIAPADHLAH